MLSLSPPKKSYIKSINSGFLYVFVCFIHAMADTILSFFLFKFKPLEDVKEKQHETIFIRSNTFGNDAIKRLMRRTSNKMLNNPKQSDQPFNFSQQPLLNLLFIYIFVIQCMIFQPTTASNHLRTLIIIVQIYFFLISTSKNYNRDKFYLHLIVRIWQRGIEKLNMDDDDVDI
jgi:hypothetical protein